MRSVCIVQRPVDAAVDRVIAVGTHDLMESFARHGGQVCVNVKAGEGSDSEPVRIYGMF